MSRFREWLDGPPIPLPVTLAVSAAVCLGFWALVAWLIFR